MIRHTEKPSQKAARAGFGGGILHDTGRGQHILINPLVINAIIEKAAIKPTDTVLEIGPGTGNLTVKLLEVAKKVVACEVDPRMANELQKRVQGKHYASKLQVIKGDAIKTDFPFFNVCVANVPYAISSPLVFKLLNHKPAYRCCVLMFQREFALRMVARPPSSMWCRLSTNCQLLAKVDHLMKISARSFKPPPKVESSVVRIEPRHPPPPIDFNEWDEMIKICMNRKHKKLHGLFLHSKTVVRLHKIYLSHCTLSNIEPKPVEDFKKLLLDALASPSVDGAELLYDRRAAGMQLEDFMFLLRRMSERGIRFK
jgi:18S rRNA (adenine1779-N6/adenine1780-N6)-dimethyltransferase